jgi:plasmid stabilization system protein ParE
MEDMQAIRTFIGKHDPATAQKVAQTIRFNVNTLLSENPKLGRPGRVPGTRELVIPQMPIIIPYRVHTGVIEVLCVYHAARRWREQL